MKSHRAEASFPVPVGALWAYHEHPGAFARLAPPWQGYELPPFTQTSPLREGHRVRFALKEGPLALPWVARHEEIAPGRAFVDVQEAGPFAAWRHEHRFEPEGEAASRLIDTVRYALPGGPLGSGLAGAFVEKQLARLFAFRHARTRRDLARQKALGERPLRVLISGATGMLGSALAAYLQTGGHTVFRLTRRPAGGDSGDVGWNPEDGRLDPAALEGLDAVVHLAGESIAGGRWTPERKGRIMESRVRSTRLLAETIAGLQAPPRVFVSASAIGFYGDRGTVPLTELDSAGTGFLAEVCQAWEDAAAPARAAGVRVVHPRTGIVLTPGGGALAPLLTPFRLGLGGPVGTGRQMMSWIALDDWVGALAHVLVHEALKGPVNFTAPTPVSNAELTRTLGRVLGRPAALPLPAFALWALLGRELAQTLLLDGADVRPAALEASGFRFETPTLEAALRFELGLLEDDDSE